MCLNSENIVYINGFLPSNDGDCENSNFNPKTYTLVCRTPTHACVVYVLFAAYIWILDTYYAIAELFCIEV